MISAVIVVADSQPVRAPPDRAKVRQNSVTAIDTCPAGSMRRRTRGTGDSGTHRRPAVTSAANGRQMRKTLRHPTAATSIPPMTGPTAVDTPAVALHEPSALLRATESWNTPVSNEIDAGVINDPPTPCNTRHTMSSANPDETKHSSEAAPNRTTPIRKIRRGP